MHKISSMMGAGVAPLAALAVAGSISDNISAAGSTQGTATAITGGDIVVVTTCAASAGIILGSATTYQPGDKVIVANLGANACAVYPATGEIMNTSSANAAFSVGAGKVGVFVRRSATSWLALLGA